MSRRAIKSDDCDNQGNRFVRIHQFSDGEKPCVFAKNRQCLSAQTWRFTAYIRPAMASRKRMTRTPVRLRSSMCGSAAQDKNSTTSEASWSSVGLVPSAYCTLSSANGGGMPILWPEKYLLKLSSLVTVNSLICSGVSFSNGT